MEVRTTRFGTLEIAPERIIKFPKGLLGFESFTQFCLLQPNDDACFYWLQSLDDPALAFVVTDPNMFVPEFAVPIREEQAESLGLAKLEDAQIFVIVNKISNKLTANMQGPLVVNTVARVAEQFVLAEKKWTTRHELMTITEPAAKASA
ncbi:MAG: flagellar assembly protein FliW [Phycisphaeraceae bacterium]|nr:flagellar assembly protein FliW [Phycisphaerales bacterium]MCA9305786.1 flagellar assembly protein FliW [Phycisphaerales bacterium]MCB9843078.1 flagellar assembly protein FliW [Phycisphaeraceae bacterium]